MHIMEAADRDPRPPTPSRRRTPIDDDQLIVLRGVSWEQYMGLDRARGDDCSRPAMAYLDGELELVTTSRPHELVKKLLARLVETYAEERSVRLDGYGNATLRNEASKAGAEPDEWYWMSPEHEAPDLAIEVVFTSGGIDKLEIYRRLGAREVWFWTDGKIWPYHLVDGAYVEITGSTVLPGIDLDRLERLIAGANEHTDQTALIRAYRRSL